MKAGENLTGDCGFSFQKFEKPDDFPLDELGEFRTQHGLICIDVTDKLLSLTVFLARSKGEQVGAAIGIEHPVEGSSLEPTSRTIDCSQGREAVE